MQQKDTKNELQPNKHQNHLQAISIALNQKNEKKTQT